MFWDFESYMMWVNLKIDVDIFNILFLHVLDHNSVFELKNKKKPNIKNLLNYIHYCALQGQFSPE